MSKKNKVYKNINTTYTFINSPVNQSQIGNSSSLNTTSSLTSATTNSDKTKGSTKEMIKETAIQTITQNIITHIPKILFAIAIAILFIFNKTPLTDDSSQVFYMPNLVGMSYDNAVSLMHKYTLKANLTQKKQYSSSDNQNRITRQSIPAKEPLNKDKMYDITVIVGKGEPVVPDIRNKKVSKAKEDLEHLNLKYKIKKTYSSSVKKGAVVQQSIVGKPAAPGTVIELTVSRGKKPAPPAPTRPPGTSKPLTPKKPVPTLEVMDESGPTLPYE